MIDLAEAPGVNQGPMPTGTVLARKGRGSRKGDLLCTSIVLFGGFFENIRPRLRLAS